MTRELRLLETFRYARSGLVPVWPRPLGIEAGLRTVHTFNYSGLFILFLLSIVIDYRWYSNALCDLKRRALRYCGVVFR